MSKHSEFNGMTDRLIAELHKQSEIADQLIILIQAYQENLMQIIKDVNEPR